MTEVYLTTLQLDEIKFMLSAVVNWLALLAGLQVFGE